MAFSNSADRARAWAVHALTLSGFVFAMLATVALIEGRIAWMWLWLAIAMMIDGVDGTLARRARVKEVLPWFDGGVVDIVVDYLTWTFIPAVFMAIHLPMGPKPVPELLAIVVLISSMFCYANANWKSTDHYFVGFPAAWNVVAVAMYVLATPGWANIVITLVLAVLTLVPTHYTHPFRVRKFMAINIAAILTWVVATGALVALHPVRPTWLLVLFWLGGGWFLVSGMLRDVRGRTKAAGDHVVS
ncbi:phosphatidylcholine/phosphatidylserine synthase [uncultured Tessaracoccus sp.]|uniref:CDP-alcohol phosphatidyltransferase family protein n=1 Tax=uncultured Tessaracoccus sp. TaxID=905023 RepID=UPI0026220668|nr:CDP-alcohol phosphatidyltransferase family protein [uncultured Tessaracoccus sp.]